MVAKHRIAVLFASGLFGCGPQPQPASEANATNPVNTAPTPSAAPTLSAAPSVAVQAGDDPKTCLDQTEVAERAWLESAGQKLDEKLPSLTRCAQAGKLMREERFHLDTSFSPSGAWQPPTGSATTLPDCRVIACVEKELAKTKIDPRAGEKAPPLSFDFFLSPSSPPRPVNASDPPFPFKDAKRCAGEVTPGGVSGRIAPEVIQKVVRSHYTEFRACYEQGLARNRNLKGRITVRFVIERDGSVARPSIYDLTLPDCKVAHCIRDAFPKMKFPAPEGGIVTVVYPVMLEPG